MICVNGNESLVKPICDAEMMSPLLCLLCPRRPLVCPPHFILMKSKTFHTLCTQRDVKSRAPHTERCADLLLTDVPRDYEGPEPLARPGETKSTDSLSSAMKSNSPTSQLLSSSRFAFRSAARCFRRLTVLRRRHWISTVATKWWMSCSKLRLVFLVQPVAKAMTNAGQERWKTRAGPVSTVSHRHWAAFKADNPSLWSYFTVWVNRTSHNLAFVFPNRLDYGNGRRTSDANSLCLQISDVSYNFQEKIHFSPNMQEKGSNLLRDSPDHVFVQLLAKRKKHDGKHPKKLNLCNLCH